MPLYVTNPTDKTVYLKSFDGDSVPIHGKSKRAKISSKFGWQVPAVRGLRIEDDGPDIIDPNRIVRPRSLPQPAKRPQGHHNKSRLDPMPYATTKEYYQKVSAANPKRAEMMAKERARLEANFLADVRKKEKKNK